MNLPTDKPVLIIGYGNTLRGDDAAGRLVVERFAMRSIPNVVTISVTQLVPELALHVSEARAVIFVDACMSASNYKIKASELNHQCIAIGETHVGSPNELLALTKAVYGQSPRAWLIAVPAVEFALADTLSHTAQNNVTAAVRVMENFLAELQESEADHA